MKFTKKISKVGQSFMVIIPKAYVTDGLLKLDQEYTFEVTLHLDANAVEESE